MEKNSNKLITNKKEKDIVIEIRENMKTILSRKSLNVIFFNYI